MRLSLAILVTTLILNIALADELVIIQSVSTSGKSFIVNRGRTDDISIGQQRAFSTDKISIICQVAELGPYHSLWEVSDLTATVPFEKDQKVFLHSSLRDIMSQVIFEERKKKQNLELLPYALKKKMGTRYVARPKYIVRMSASRALSDSQTGQNTEVETSKQGLHFEGLYTRKFIIGQFDWALGVRYDRESEENKTHDMISPITRQMFIGELSYHFEQFSETLNNLYITFGAGIGKSEASVNSISKEGTVISFPYVKLGYLNQVADDSYLVFDGTLESLTTKETFIDASDQKTTSLNGKFTIGYRFNLF